MDRQAQCSACKRLVPSDSGHLAFFEATGEGTDAAVKHCGNCGYYESAHNHNPTDTMRSRSKFICSKFVPHGPWEYDRYYCGCRGWD